MSEWPPKPNFVELVLEPKVINCEGDYEDMLGEIAVMAAQYPEHTLILRVSRG